MSKKATEFQKKAISMTYRGKGIFKPAHTGWIDDHVACVREWIANIFFYKKGNQILMIDAGYNYDRLEEKMAWLDIDPSMIHDILITHQDTDHVGAIEEDGPGLFKEAKVYISDIENRYLVGIDKRKVYYHMYALEGAKIDNPKKIIHDGQVFMIGDIKVEAILCPGHTKGHMVYLIDDTYLFTGDALWLGADGGYAFINVLADDIEEEKESLEHLKNHLEEEKVHPIICTGHTSWTDDFEFAFRHIDQVCNAWKLTQEPKDPTAPTDGFDDSEDTEIKARNQRIPQAYKAWVCPDYRNWMPKEVVTASAACTGTLGLLSWRLHHKKTHKKLRKLLGFTAGLGAVITAGSIFAYRMYSYKGKRKLSEQIINGIAEYIDLPENGIGLDVGCGSGALTIACAKNNPQGKMIGIDRWGKGYHEYSQNLCKQNANAEHVKNISFQKGDALHLDFNDETFDAITSNYVYHNIPSLHRQEIVLESLRTLKKGGTFAIHDIFSKAIYGDMDQFVQKLKKMGYEKVELIDTTDGKYMTKQEALLLGCVGAKLLIGKK